MIRMYGSMLCKDCVQCREDLDKANVAYEYLDFSEDLSSLKEFLRLRDTCALFEQVRAEGRIGIPCIVKDNGAVTLDWAELLM